MSGLLHISQISFDRIEDLPSILQMGMPLKCMIIDHDKVLAAVGFLLETYSEAAGLLRREGLQTFLGFLLRSLHISNRPMCFAVILFMHLSEVTKKKAVCIVQY